MSRATGSDGEDAKEEGQGGKKGGLAARAKARVYQPHL
jgi:hypothetical protein